MATVGVKELKGCLQSQGLSNFVCQ